MESPSAVRGRRGVKCAGMLSDGVCFCGLGCLHFILTVDYSFYVFALLAGSLLDSSSSRGDGGSEYEFGTSFVAVNSVLGGSGCAEVGEVSAGPSGVALLLFFSFFYP